MKIGLFLLATFFAGESNGQGADLAQLAGTFTPEQLAALQRKGLNFKIVLFSVIYVFIY
jgi:hypothetical protein